MSKLNSKTKECTNTMYNSQVTDSGECKHRQRVGGVREKRKRKRKKKKERKFVCVETF